MGNGETELLHLLPRVLGKGRAADPRSPPISDYAAAAELAGLTVEPLPLREERGFAPDLRRDRGGSSRGDEIVFLGRPNNPTGAALSRRRPPGARRRPSRQRSSSSTRPSPISPRRRASSPPDRPANLIVLRSLTKFYAIPGLRLGAAVAARRDHPAAPRPGAPLVGEHPRPGRGRGGPPRWRTTRRRRAVS